MKIPFRIQRKTLRFPAVSSVASLAVFSRTHKGYGPAAAAIKSLKCDYASGPLERMSNGFIMISTLCYGANEPEAELVALQFGSRGE